MKNVKIVIAKRNRHEHLLKCLYYLNNCNKNKLYNVDVYVAQDDNLEKTNNYSNINVIFLNIKNDGFFNKSLLLNKGINSFINETWDWFSIIDVDMIYSDHFFDIINKNTENYDWIVCNGWKLDESTKDFEIINYPTFQDVYKLNKTVFNVGPSQISISKKGYDIVQKYFPGNLYNESFIGWGGEDSIPSSISRKLSNSGLLRKTQIQDVWLHQWHSEKDNKNHPNYENNQKLYTVMNKEIMEKVLC